MNFYVLTLFPDMINSALSYSIIGRAQNEGIINIKAIDIRDFSKSKQKHVDDYPYGGGAGMVMQAQPIYDAYKSIQNESNGAKVLYMTPQGKTFNQKMAEEYSKESDIIILCGHYEGIDERVIEEIVTDEVSIGDFVITGGEIAAITIIDAISRIVPGVLGKAESFEDESFSYGLLEYPQYTRPAEFMGRRVPDVLISGHHANISKWRKEQSLIRTIEKRPDLIDCGSLSDADKIFIEKYKNTEKSK